MFNKHWTDCAQSLSLTSEEVNKGSSAVAAQPDKLGSLFKEAVVEVEVEVEVVEVAKVVAEDRIGRSV